MNSNQPVPSVNSRRIKQLRSNQRLRAEQVAVAANLSVAQIYRLERGDRPKVAAITLARVALALNTSLEYLLGVTDDHRSIHELADDSDALPVARTLDRHESK